MKITNTHGTVIAERVESAKDFLPRLIGLMGRKSLAKNSGLLIHGCCQVHTFFMRFPIDVIYADRELRVLRVDVNVPPWHILPRCNGAFYVIELPACAGSVSIGDKLRLEDACG
ncbi:MAG: DUF192 domain-containing protein [Armatimonadetes bacterium]|nr:DUF192 domain-containing protein [Armatimonadota bacterium]